MTNNIQEIVSEIISSNNKYRDSSTTARSKLEALWDIGNKLVNSGVTKPHAVGWAVQRETKGLIKRSTVIRGHKVRHIWVVKDELLKDLSSIKSMSNLFEIFPLIDPSQVVRKKLSQKEIKDLYCRVCNDSPKKFKEHIKIIKQKYSHGQLGRPLDRSRHLKDLESIVSNFRIFINYLTKIINDVDISDRDNFRVEASNLERKAFSNACISLTTKENLRLYKHIGPSISESKNQEFSTLYNYFFKILKKTSDDKRARLRRLVSPEVFAQVSDMVSSLSTEEGVKDFKARQKMAINFKI